MKTYIKAIIAAFVAGLGSIAVGLGDNVISAQEYVTAVIVALTAFGAVYAVPNKPRE